MSNNVTEFPCFENSARSLLKELRKRLKKVGKKSSIVAMQLAWVHQDGSPGRAHLMKNEMVTTTTLMTMIGAMGVSRHKIEEIISFSQEEGEETDPDDPEEMVCTVELDTEED